MEYILDGEIDLLSDEWAGAFRVVEEFEFSLENPNFIRLQKEFFGKYLQYLYSFDMEKLIDILIDKLIRDPSEEVAIIYRPSWAGLEPTFGIKFKRSKNDNLGKGKWTESKNLESKLSSYRKQ